MDTFHRRKASFSSSPLAFPEKPIQRLAIRFQEHLHLPDPVVLYALIGALAGNMMQGDLIWLMLVGAPGSGKTELLLSLLGVPGIRNASSISGEAALLSGVPRKERMEGAKGGLLREIGEAGMLVFKDFTSVLSKSELEGAKLYAALRECYDGSWSRDVGGDGGRQLAWKGRLAVCAGVTDEIDEQHQKVAAMGERFILLRMPKTDGWSESNKNLDMLDKSEIREDLQSAVLTLIADLDLSWRHLKPRPTLKQSEKDRIIALAQISARCRSIVIRDRWTREITAVPDPEVSTRLSGELGQLYIGMALVGVPIEERWQVLQKIAFDSMPPGRSIVVKALKAGLRQAAEIREHAAISREVTSCSRTTIERTLQDLEALGVVEHSADKGWLLREWIRKLIASGWRWDKVPSNG